MAKGRLKKQDASGEERYIEEIKEVKLNVIQATLHFKVSQTSKAVMLKKFKDESMTVHKWEGLLSKHKINF